MAMGHRSVTPHSVAKIIADILVGNDKPQNVRIYDPSAVLEPCS